MHGSDDIRPCWLTYGVGFIICQDHHVLLLVTVLVLEESLHPIDVVDASSQLVWLTDIIDSNEQRFSGTRAIRILELIVRGSTMAELLRDLWRRLWIVPDRRSPGVCADDQHIYISVYMPRNDLLYDGTLMLCGGGGADGPNV